MKDERRDPEGRESPGAQRMRYVRIAEGFDNANLWAAHIGMTNTQISNYENGIPLSKVAAIRLAQRVPGLTTDYLLLGRKEALAFDLRKRIDAAELSESGKTSEPASPAPKSRSRSR